MTHCNGLKEGAENNVIKLTNNSRFYCLCFNTEMMPFHKSSLLCSSNTRCDYEHTVSESNKHDDWITKYS